MFRAPFCKLWLVGLKMNENALENCQNLSSEELQKLMETFNWEFDTKIYKEYDVKVLRGWYQHIRLSSTYVKSTDLAKW